MVRLVLVAIKLYQKGISPCLPRVCRFAPSCSEYALDAFAKYGMLKGLYLSLGRLLRCHPFHPGGYEPVP